MDRVFIIVTICYVFITLSWNSTRARLHLLPDSFLGVLARMAGGMVDCLGLHGVWFPQSLVSLPLELCFLVMESC